MANLAPGVSINVSAATSNNGVNAPTGTWFAVGMAAGPAGIAVPINSISDFNTYFGQIVNGQVTGRYTLNATVDSTLLYDSIDVFFREGGVNAIVSRVQPTSSGVAATSGTTGGKFNLTAIGKGTWANSAGGSAAGVVLTITFVSANNFTASIAYNGIVTASVSGITSDTDVINWINGLPGYKAFVTASSAANPTILPSSGSVSVYLTGGTDVAVADGDTDAALAVFTDVYGPGQVSYPGNTSGSVYVKLANHAQVNNRVAGLDGSNTGTAATLVTAVSTLQAAAVDPSYASMFAPWVNVPGVVNSNPNTPAGVIFPRTVPPSAFAAANMAANDQIADCNVPAAGVKAGNLTYATNITQTYSSADRATLNAAGVNVIRNVANAGVIAIYGFRSCAVDQNWAFLNNVRFRMQVIHDFDFIAESFVFQEIDNHGHVFAKLNGSLAGQCQAYWTRQSIYGATAGESFSVNTGPQINTPTTIAAGQINAAVNLRMSPFGEFVTVNVTKYLSNAPLPQQ